MRYEEIIQTEDTDCLYDMWREYREDLTEYIIASVEHDYIRRQLREEAILRPKKTYNIEEMLKAQKEKPVLAIWGAGGCNDIDIVRLSGCFRLVLIDRDVEKIKAARMRFGLGEQECLCVNLHFWNIEHEDYKLFEAMLCDQERYEVVEAYLRKMTEDMYTPDYTALPDFDYSVVVGLASQLNVRLAAMADVYGAYGMLAGVLREMNDAAVHRLMEAVEHMTQRQIILGYELQNVSMNSEEEAERLRLCLDEEREYADFVSNRVLIAGNDVLERYVRMQIETKRWNILCHRALLWRFSRRKRYLMLNLTLVRQGDLD